MQICSFSSSLIYTGAEEIPSWVKDMKKLEYMYVSIDKWLNYFASVRRN